MTEFTYTPPESTTFVHTLKSYLQQIGKDYIASLLVNSKYELSDSGKFSNVRHNSYNATVKFLVPVDLISKLEEVREDLLYAVQKVFPSEVGF